MLGDVEGARFGFDAIDICPCSQSAVPLENRGVAVAVQSLADDMDSCVWIITVIDQKAAQGPQGTLRPIPVLAVAPVNRKTAFDMVSSIGAQEFNSYCGDIFSQRNAP